MFPLNKTLRSQLERTIRDAREIAEAAARATLEQLGVGDQKCPDHLSQDERDLRRRLRIHGRQLGDILGSGVQKLDNLVEETAYEHWHRMLFARFLAENNLLMYPDPDNPVPVTLEECEDLAAEEGAANGWELAARYATTMLPQIFRVDTPVFELALPPEHQQKLEGLLSDLSPEVFNASDSLGWVYQFWQSKRKEDVNASEVKIGARELPAVTQLFTEPYMVDFLLHNSLGAWWASHVLTEEDFRNARSEEELRKKASLEDLPLEYLRFVKVESTKVESTKVESSKVEAASCRFPASSNNKKHQNASSIVEAASCRFPEKPEKRQDIASMEGEEKREDVVSTFGEEDVGEEKREDVVSTFGEEDVGEEKREDVVSTFGEEDVGEEKRQDAASTFAERERQKPGNYFSPNDTIENLSGNLPHWRQENVTYFVTFRTADSLPQEKLSKWQSEKDEWLKKHPEPHDEATKKDFYTKFPQRLQKWLDQDYGAAVLKKPELRKIVEGAICHFNGDRYDIDDFVVMPNHVHVIITPRQNNELSDILQSWKSFTAKEINKRINKTGTFWQKESFDHIIRSEKQLNKIRNYIKDHPAYKVEAASCRFPASNHKNQQNASTKVEAASCRSLEKLEKRQGVASIMEKEGKRQDAASTLGGEEIEKEMLWQPAGGSFDAWPQKLSDLKVLDPCCGSGHFLIAALNMLARIRMAYENLTAKEAVDRVLEQNLHGLEIDKRCVEIAAFALAFTAWRFPGAGGYRKLPELNLACSGLALSVSREEWNAAAHNVTEQFIGSDDLTLFPEMRNQTMWHTQITGGMARLYDEFQNAPVLGSLLNPGITTADLFAADFKQLHKLLADVMSKTKATEEENEIGIVAYGMSKAGDLLTRKYHLVITNVPYLARGKQDEQLRSYCQKNYPEAKNDLATVFLDRCLQFCYEGGTTSVVLPQNWLFLTSYKKFREKLLTNELWNMVARLGPGAFETISGEVVKAVLLSLSRGKEVESAKEFARRSVSDWVLHGVDVSEPRTAAEKAAGLVTAEVKGVEQRRQLENPDARIVLIDIKGLPNLENCAQTGTGIQTFDSPRFLSLFWEYENLNSSVYTPCQSSVANTDFYDGLSQLLKWQGGQGELHQMMLAKEKYENYRSAIWKAWSRNISKRGICVSLMNTIPCSLYMGYSHDNNTGVIIPNSSDCLLALWCFCESSDFNRLVRMIDQKLNVTNATLGKVPFDLEHWTRVAAEKYPHGLPKPYSDDPTQWIFHGHPCGSVVWDEKEKRLEVASTLRNDDTVLQVAVARLLGYRWPAELDEQMELSEESRTLVEKCESLLSFADEDGIVCIPPVRGEAGATDRLLNLLAAAYGDKWSTDVLNQLLSNCDHAGKTLETWLRDKFFLQHCKIFQHRPFIWHIWDGLRDGFSALVNYHKLDAKHLETLIYTYLGDWITRQKQDIANGVDGAEEKLSAAEQLKKKLELIHEGEAPYDIFVRWKPLAEQPIGWNPDLNDGVRLNIRPFMTAGVLRFNKKPQLNVTWGKDRGKDVESAPWYHKFKGDRINDFHLSLEEKLVK